jgi:hypothetical protein
LGANATDGASPSPRTWPELSNMIIQVEKDHGSDLATLTRTLGIIAEARVGQEASIEFMKHVKVFQKFDFKSILEKKDKKFAVTNDISDQILMAFIIRYIQSEEDAEYLIDLINANKDRRTFISIFIQEFDTMYNDIGKMPDGKTKKAFTKLSDLVVDDTKVDSDLITIFVDGLLDVT